EIVGVDSLDDAYDVRLKRWRLARLTALAGFSFQQVDICNRTELEEVFRAHACDRVVNLAARAGVRRSLVDPWAYYQSNVIGTLNLLTCCRDHGIKTFVLASTSSLYAGSAVPFDEQRPTDRPLSPYAASKKAAEVLCHSYAHLYGVSTTVLRYFTVYGPAGRPDMSPFRLVQWISEGRPVTIYGDGRQSRDFAYVDDVAAGTLAAVAVADGYEIINLGSEQQVPLLEAIHIVERLVGREATLVHLPPSPADLPATRASIAKAKAQLGWSPQVKIEQGLAHLVGWYRDNRSWAKDIETA
ncbi:MAG TPA: NAD-dependent epimerase/dehydratase family protein, partial [bacterium]